MLNDLFAAIAKMLHDTTANILQSTTADIVGRRGTAGVVSGSLPSGEIEPTVMLAWAPAEPAREREIEQLIRLLRE